jgi:hypothetical protein
MFEGKSLLHNFRFASVIPFVPPHNFRFAAVIPVVPPHDNDEKKGGKKTGRASELHGKALSWKSPLVWR